MGSCLYRITRLTTGCLNFQGRVPSASSTTPLSSQHYSWMGPCIPVSKVRFWNPEVAPLRSRGPHPESRAYKRSPTQQPSSPATQQPRFPLLLLYRYLYICLMKASPRSGLDPLAIARDGTGPRKFAFPPGTTYRRQTKTHWIEMLYLQIPGELLSQVSVDLCTCIRLLVFCRIHSQPLPVGEWRVFTSTSQIWAQHSRSFANTNSFHITRQQVSYAPLPR